MSEITDSSLYSLLLFLTYLFMCLSIYLFIYLLTNFLQNLNVAAVTPVVRVLMNCAASVHGTAVEVRLQISKEGRQ